MRLELAALTALAGMASGGAFTGRWVSSSPPISDDSSGGTGRDWRPIDVDGPARKPAFTDGLRATRPGRRTGEPDRRLRF
jgi:hypothetical protein